MHSLPGQPPRDAVRFQRLRVLFALVVREMGTRFGRSWGGYVWAVAEPLGGIVLLTIAFSIALRSPPIGTSFALFYATGVVPLFLFNRVSSTVSSAVATNRGLLRYPVVTTLDAVLGKFVLEFLTGFVVGVLLFTGIILWSDLSVNLDPAAAFVGFALAGFLGLGVGTLNCVLFGFFPTWRQVWNVLTRPLFLMSGLFYTFESLPAQLQAILWYNPVIHIVGRVRSGFYGSYDANYVVEAYPLGIAGVTFVIGAYLLRRHSSFLIEQ